MNVFVAWTVDHLDGLIATSLMSENIEELRQISHNIKRGSDMFKSWAMASGGSPILDLGHTGCVQVPADRMTELPVISKKFEELCDATLSVGVGISLSESYTAMKFSMHKGGDRASLYHVEMEEELKDDKESNYDLSGLAKGQNDQVVGMADQVGFAASAQHGAGGKFAAKPAETHPPVAAPPIPDQPEPGSIDMGIDDNGQQPQGGDEGQDGEQQDPRTAVVNALKEIKRQAPVLEQLKQSNPDAFNAVKEVVDAMILMAQGMASQGESIQKSEENSERCNTCGLSKDEHDDLNKGGQGTHHEWAVGTMKDGKVKVTHKDIPTSAPTGTGWHSVRAGQIMSEDGHAISARNPHGK